MKKIKINFKNYMARNLVEFTEGTYESIESTKWVEYK